MGLLGLGGLIAYVAMRYFAILTIPFVLPFAAQLSLIILISIVFLAATAYLFYHKPSLPEKFEFSIDPKISTRQELSMYLKGLSTAEKPIFIRRMQKFQSSSEVWVKIKGEQAMARDSESFHQKFRAHLMKSFEDFSRSKPSRVDYPADKKQPDCVKPSR